MKIVRYILFPVVPIYFFVSWLRNKLYDAGVKTSKSYTLPIICVGNLSVGGTGKTPMIEYLIKLLKDEYKLATLSRGYKRKTEGFQLAGIHSTANSIGDEPFQFYSKFKDNVLVAVDSDRQHGIKCLQNSEPDLILLDDAFQHRKVKAGLNILLTTYNRPYYKDVVLPTGDLREPRSGAERANIIIVTKCPKDLSDYDKSAIIKRINPRRFQSVFFSSITYSETLYSANEFKALDEVSGFTLVTGIANATPLVQFLEEKQLEFEHLNFKDHHDFSPRDINTLKTKDLIITTEKDYMRLKQYEALRDRLFYLPITVNIDSALVFNKTIIDFIRRH